MCQTLDDVHTVFFLILLSESPHRRSIIGSFHCKMWFSMILLLSGDIHLNPGPPVQINFSHLNICSASSVTAQLNKPVALAEFISDHNIEILSLYETRLSSDALPSTLNALAPPNFSIVHQPRLTGKGVGLHLFTVHSSKRPGSLCPRSQHLKRCAYRFPFSHRFSNL